MNKSEEKKVKYLLHQISKNENENNIVEIYNYSNFMFDTITTGTYGSLRVKHYLFIYLHPEIYAKHYGLIKNIERIILDRINNIATCHIDSVKISPDYSKLAIIDTGVNIVYTSWEEINQNQDKLFDLLNVGSDSIDYQNIGNTARTIMLKLAKQVFDLTKHISKAKRIDLTEGKFKNQLHIYIDSVLSGKKNKEFRQLAEVSIEYVEKSIDLMNTITHKTDAEKHLAEVCVISTISAISIIKLIAELEI